MDTHTFFKECMERLQTFNVSNSNGNTEEAQSKIYCKSWCPNRVFHGTIVAADIGSLKSLHIFLIPRLQETHFVTRLPKEHWLPTLSRFSLKGIRFLWFWYQRIGMSLFFPFIPKIVSVVLHLTSQWRILNWLQETPEEISLGFVSWNLQVNLTQLL